MGVGWSREWLEIEVVTGDGGQSDDQGCSGNWDWGQGGGDKVVVTADLSDD